MGAIFGVGGWGTKENLAEAARGIALKRARRGIVEGLSLTKCETYNPRTVAVTVPKT